MATSGRFHRNLNLFDSTAIVMGSMIGSGIFIVSAEIARNLGAPGWLLLVWAIAGIMTVFAALSYGELSSILPNAGELMYISEKHTHRCLAFYTDGPFSWSYNVVLLLQWQWLSVSFQGFWPHGFQRRIIYFNIIPLGLITHNY